MPYSNQDRLDRQAIVNRVYTYFIVKRKPAGYIANRYCIYHAWDTNQRHVSRAIDGFDASGRLDNDRVVQRAVSRAAMSDQDFDTGFIEELDRGLRRFARRESLTRFAAPSARVNSGDGPL